MGPRSSAMDTLTRSPELSIDTESDDHESRRELHESSDEDPTFEDDSAYDDKVDAKLGNG